MITRYGKIEKVTPTIAYLRKFNYEEYTKEESKLTEYCDDYFLSDVTSSIRISSSVYNELFDAAGEPCILELLIDEVGLVHTAKIYKTFEQLKNKAEEVAKGPTFSLGVDDLMKIQPDPNMRLATTPFFPKPSTKNVTAFSPHLLMLQYYVNILSKL